MFPPAAGVRIGLFTPDRAFELVCREQIKNLREPALKLADLVTQQLITVLREGTVQVPSSSYSLYPFLWDRNRKTFLLRGADFSTFLMSFLSISFPTRYFRLRNFLREGKPRTGIMPQFRTTCIYLHEQGPRFTLTPLGFLSFLSTSTNLHPPSTSSVDSRTHD